MLKLDDTNNRSSLVGDFRMYYSGTVVSKEEEDGSLSVMLVADVTGNGRDETKVANLALHGTVVNKAGDAGVQMWKASDVLAITPCSGYYRVGDRVHYVTFRTDNRTNKKGFQNARVSYDGAGVRATLRDCWVFFNRPILKGRYSRDLYVGNSKINWKGVEVGTLHDGVVTINKEHNHVKELVCKVLGRSMAITLKDE